jgi:hypothetical protein
MVLSLLEKRQRDRDYRYFKNLKDLYNISKDEYYSFLNEQNNTCANKFCRKKPGDYGRETHI